MDTISGLLPLNFARITAEKGKAPTRILLLKDGDINWAGLDGFELDQETADRLISAFTQQGVDLPIDYHHASTSVEQGKQAKAPAAGWIKRLEYVEGEGLYAAEVEWTPEAEAEIESKAYKYISPVILSNSKTKAINELHSVALTNRPRTIGAPELLAAARLLEPTKGITMDPEKLKGVIEGLCAGLRIKAQDDLEQMPAIDDTTKAIADLIEALKAAGMEPEQGATLTSVIVAATEFIAQNVADVDAPSDTDKEETPEEEAARVAKEKTDLEAAVKAGNYDKMAERVKALESQQADRDTADKSSRVDALIQKGIDEHRLNPNDEGQLKAARALAESDEKTCAEFIDSLEPYAPVGKHATDSKAGRNARERAIIEASRAYDEDGMMHTVGAASKRSYVDVILGETDETELTDAESEKLEVVS